MKMKFQQALIYVPLFLQKITAGSAVHSPQTGS